MKKIPMMVDTVKLLANLLQKRLRELVAFGGDVYLKTIIGKLVRKSC